MESLIQTLISTKEQLSSIANLYPSISKKIPHLDKAKIQSAIESSKISKIRSKYQDKTIAEVQTGFFQDFGFTDIQAFQLIKYFDSIIKTCKESSSSELSGQMFLDGFETALCENESEQDRLKAVDLEDLENTTTAQIKFLNYIFSKVKQSEFLAKEKAPELVQSWTAPSGEEWQTFVSSTIGEHTIGYNYDRIMERPKENILGMAADGVSAGHRFSGIGQFAPEAMISEIPKELDIHKKYISLNRVSENKVWQEALDMFSEDLDFLESFCLRNPGGFAVSKGALDFWNSIFSLHADSEEDNNVIRDSFFRLDKIIKPEFSPCLDMLGDLDLIKVWFQNHNIKIEKIRESAADQELDENLNAADKDLASSSDSESQMLTEGFYDEPGSALYKLCKIDSKLEVSEKYKEHLELNMSMADIFNLIKGDLSKLNINDYLRQNVFRDLGESTSYSLTINEDIAIKLAIEKANQRLQKTIGDFLRNPKNQKLMERAIDINGDLTNPVATTLATVIDARDSLIFVNCGDSKIDPIFASDEPEAALKKCFMKLNEPPRRGGFEANVVDVPGVSYNWKDFQASEKPNNEKQDSSQAKDPDFVKLLSRLQASMKKENPVGKINDWRQADVRWIKVPKSDLAGFVIRTDEVFPGKETKDQYYATQMDEIQKLYKVHRKPDTLAAAILKNTDSLKEQMLKRDDESIGVYLKGS